MALKENCEKSGPKRNAYGSVTRKAKERYPLPLDYEDYECRTHPKCHWHKASHAGVFCAGSKLLNCVGLGICEFGCERLSTRTSNKNANLMAPSIA